MARAVDRMVKLLPAKPRLPGRELGGGDGSGGGAGSCGTPFHQGHQIVGRSVLESVRSGRKPAPSDGEQMAQFAPEFTGDMAALLDPRKGM